MNEQSPFGVVAQRIVPGSDVRQRLQPLLAFAQRLLGAAAVDEIRRLLHVQIEQPQALLGSAAAATDNTSRSCRAAGRRG